MAFFASLHGKNACAGVRSTIKSLPASASLQRSNFRDQSLQRSITDQILNPIHLFQFAKNKITEVTCLLVDTFTNSLRFKGTGKNH